MHNLVGQKFGMLIVESYLESRRMPDGHSRNHWLCHCDCGGSKELTTTELRGRRGNRSCGCLSKLTGNKHKHWRGFEEIGAKYWTVIQRNARDRNIEFDITIEYAWEVFTKQDRRCALSGRCLDLYQSYAKKIYPTASLDRIDSKLGYVVGNIQWLHVRVNMMKNSYPQSEFIQLCSEISDFYRGK